MRLPNPICWLEALYRTLRTGVWMRGWMVAGHVSRQESRLNNCIVTVLKCERCDKYTVLWEPTARSTHQPYPDEVVEAGA